MDPATIPTPPATKRLPLKVPDTTLARERDDYVDLRPYFIILREKWLPIASATLAAVLAAGLVAKFALTRWYRAEAIIRPVSGAAIESRLTGLLGGIAGGGLGGLGAAAAMLGRGGTADAEEYLSILRSFEFNTALAERHHLGPDFLKRNWMVPSFLEAHRDPRWRIYRALKKRFAGDFSMKTGNITLYYQEKNREKAEQILGYYINDLRALLRAREVTGASAALTSLEDEAATTPDELLRTQLEVLAAKQMQRKKLAQVEADFAFTVIDPPAAPDRPYSPWPLLDGLVAGVLAFIASTLVAVNKHRVRD